MADLSEEVIDARIKEELEALNNASNSINKLENEFQRARSTFKQQKEECSSQLMACSRSVGRQSILRSKEYYQLLEQLIKIQGEVQKATQNFQKANSVYKAALETVSLAEEQLVNEEGARVVFDGAWQDMLNHANLRFSEAEKDRRACEVEHARWSKEYGGMKSKLGSLQRNNAKSIFKSKSFYELKRKFESRLQAEKQNVDDLQFALNYNKQKYRLALSKLERISQDLHLQRGHRSPGVGAESDCCSELSDTINLNFDFLSETSSQVSSGDLADLDSDLMQEWQEQEQEQDISLFTKVSTRFNRSTSLSNLGDRNKFPLSTMKQSDFLSATTSPQPSFPAPQQNLHTNLLANAPNFVTPHSLASQPPLTSPSQQFQTSSFNVTVATKSSATHILSTTASGPQNFATPQSSSTKSSTTNTKASTPPQQPIHLALQQHHKPTAPFNHPLNLHPQSGYKAPQSTTATAAISNSTIATTNSTVSPRNSTLFKVSVSARPLKSHSKPQQPSKQISLQGSQSASPNTAPSNNSTNIKNTNNSNNDNNTATNNAKKNNTMNSNNTTNKLHNNTATNSNNKNNSFPNKTINNSNSITNNNMNNNISNITNNESNNITTKSVKDNSKSYTSSAFLRLSSETR